MKSMKHSTQHKLLAAALGALAAVILVAVQPAAAADRECVKDCLDADKVCMEALRGAANDCKLDAGCDVLQEITRDICRAEEPDPEACRAARDAVRECVAPCRDAVRDALDICAEATGVCLNEVCNVEVFCPKRRGPKRPRPNNDSPEPEQQG